jgi:NADH:ubiquinone oxidoreductase subunit 6 (subunit J)
MVVWLVLLAGGCIALSLLISAGRSMGYSGVVLGIMAAGGSGALFMKGPQGLRKISVGGALFGILFVVLGFMGAAEKREQEAVSARAAEAVQRKADADKAQHEKLVVQLCFHSPL